MSPKALLREKAISIDQRNMIMERWIWLGKALEVYKDEEIHNVKRAKMNRYVLSNFSIDIDKNDLLVGRSVDTALSPKDEATIEQVKEYYETAGALNGGGTGSTGHRVIDFEKLLNKGVVGILKEIDEKNALIDYSDSDASEKRYFYEACRISLEGLMVFAKRYKEELIKLHQEEKNEERKNELGTLIEIFKRVPYNPAQGFYEAIQCSWFVQYATHVVEDTNLAGRPDNYLYPYYKYDIDAGKITNEFVFELIEDYYYKHNDLYGNWPGAIMIGGVDRKGNPNWNALSYMMIKAIKTTGLVNPSVSVAYNEYMPPDLLDECLEVIGEGYTRPSIFNDNLIIKGLIDAGADLEDARYYIHSTCVEITPIGNSNIRVATPFINLCKAFEYVFNDGKVEFGEDIPLLNGEIGERFRIAHEVNVSLPELDSFYKFLDKVKEVVEQMLKAYLTITCDMCYAVAKYSSSPLVSCFTNDCIQKGKDAASGGAKYNFVYPCFPGFISFADSILAVKKAVYEDKIVSLEELKDALNKDFSQEGRLREYLLNKCPKCGNDNDEADEIAVLLFDFLKNELSKYKNALGGTFHSSYFAWIKHGQLGERTLATMDGRKQGEALSECLGCVQGMDKNGISALVNSTAKFDQKSAIGGIAINLRLSKNIFTDQLGKKALSDFVKVFMDKGCFEMQFNVVDQKVLKEAKESPEKYRTLMVRVAGYSDYFINLRPNVQDEVIKRYEHECS